jgi:hypothetical protein
MTLENKIIQNYFKNLFGTIINSESDENFAKIHIDNPLGPRIKGDPHCKICKGEGYFKCRSGKHEQACHMCLSNVKVEKRVEYINKHSNQIMTKLVSSLVGCKKCKGTGLVKVKNYQEICDCSILIQ